MAASHIFRIMFVNQGKVYEIYARKVSHGELFGFIEVEELRFRRALHGGARPVARSASRANLTGVKRTLPAAAFGAAHR